MNQNQIVYPVINKENLAYFIIINAFKSVLILIITKTTIV